MFRGSENIFGSALLLWVYSQDEESNGSMTAEIDLKQQDVWHVWVCTSDLRILIYNKIGILEYSYTMIKYTTVNNRLTIIWLRVRKDKVIKVEPLSS